MFPAAAVKKEKSLREGEFKTAFKLKTKIPSKQTIKTVINPKKGVLKRLFDFLLDFPKKDLILLCKRGRIVKSDWKI